jgi:hypothetical protein
MLPCCLLLFACNAAQRDEKSLGGTAEDDSQGSIETADTDSQDSTDTRGSGDESDLPGCDPLECASQCALMYDPCVNSMVGSCSYPDTCECSMSAPCLPCAEQECGAYEECGTGDFPDYGECHLVCEYEFEYSWAQEFGCMIAQPQDLPDIVLSIFYLRIAGMMIPRTDACGDPEEPDSWVLDEQTSIIMLCGETCLLFESVGELQTGWSVPCE